MKVSIPFINFVVIIPKRLTYYQSGKRLNELAKAQEEQQEVKQETFTETSTIPSLLSSFTYCYAGSEDTSFNSSTYKHPSFHRNPDEQYAFLP